MSDDPVEKIVEAALDLALVTYERPPGGPDFVLTEMDCVIECKQFYTERAVRQMAGQPNAILIQGVEAARAFAALIAVRVMNS